MVAKVFAGRYSRAERAQQRKHINLEDASLSDKTRSRYYSALRKLLPTVEACKSEASLDMDISDWIMTMWSEGEPLLTIGDALCALHFFQPTTRRLVPHSWKLFKVWRKVEVPCRAPPLTWELVSSMTAYCIDHCYLEMAAILSLSFHCLLRTGEALSLSFEDIIIGTTSGICRLQNTKSGRRHSASEVISITNLAVLEILRALAEWRSANGLPKLKIWSRTAATFRQQFKRLMQVYDVDELGFRPYSLRRGGATALFQETHSMEAALLRGRWESSRVARIYISDGLSHLPRLRMSSTTATMLQRFRL